MGKISILILVIFILSSNLYGADDIKTIKSELDDKDWQVRYNAIDKIKDINNEENLELLIKVAGTRSEYWPIKIKAIQLLGKSQNPKALEVLLDIFNDPFNNWECPSIKSYTAYALGNFKNNEKVLNSLIKAIDDQEVFTREAVIKSLGEIANLKAIPYLLNALKDEKVAVRISVLEALEKIGDMSAIPYIEKFIEKEDDHIIKERAIIALNNIRNNYK